MKLTPTTRRRLTILFLLLFLAGSALLAGYAYAQHRKTQRILAWRNEGMAAYEKGDYAAALDPLGRYISRKQNDAETLFAFGKSRSRVELPNGRHLAEAISYFRRGLELQPNNLDAKHQLLTIYTDPTIQYNAEANALADELLKINPKDIPALRAKAKALAAMHQFEEALKISQQLNTLDPTDLQSQRLTYELLNGLNHPDAEILARAKAGLAAHPDDPRFQLLQAFAFILTHDDKSAKEWLQKAAATKNPPDAEFIKELVGLFDSQGLYNESEAILNRVANQSADPQIKRLLIQRLWESGRYADAADRLKNLDPNAPSSDAQLLAYRAYCLYELNRPSEAHPLLLALSNRSDDDTALAWAKTLRARYESPNLTPRELINEYQGALVRDPRNPLARYFLGDTFARIGETEPAMQAWNHAANELPNWSIPRARIARALASTGRSQSAVEQAITAYRQSPNVGSAIALAVAWNSRLANQNDPTLRDKVLGLVSDIQSKLPGESDTLPIYVNLLAQSNQRDKAIAAVNQVLNSPHPPSQDTVIALLPISRANHLNLESNLLQQAQKTYGLTPSLALASALNQFADGQTDAALKTLTDQANTATADKTQWQLALATFLERTNNSKAHDAWATLGDQNPADITIQSTILDLSDTSSAWKDRAFILRTIQRLHDLTGDDANRWRFARARWLLTSPQADRDSAEAVVLLMDLVRQSPANLIPRLYLARALENVNNRPAAIEQLKSAAAMDSDSVPIAIDLARFLQANGAYPDARQYLDRAAKSPNLDPASRQRIAAMLENSGDTPSAIALLQNSPNDPTRDSLLASLYRRNGDTQKATDLYQKLLANPNCDPATIAAASDFLASQGKTDEARKSLARLDSSKMPPADRELILAAFEESHGTPDSALAHYQKALTADTTDSRAWRTLAAYYIRSSKLDQASSTIDQALKTYPQDNDLLALRAQLSAMQSNGGKGDLAQLLDAMSRDPRNAGVVEVLKVIQDSRNSNENPNITADKLRQAVDRHPDLLVAQEMMAQTYLKLDRNEDAIYIADRTARLLPNNPEAAQLLCMAYARAGKWDKLLEAAQDWRRRAIEKPFDADTAIAQAYIELDQPGNAVKQLEPYIAKAKSEPAKNLPVLTAYASALIRANRDSDASSLLVPLLKDSPQYRLAYLRLASQLKNSQAIQSWLSQITPMISPDSKDEQYALASSWYAFNIQTGDPTALATARQLAQTLSLKKDADAGSHLLLGAIAERQNDHTAAINAYRRALELNPNLPVAQNNLAYQLYTSAPQDQLPEARTLAERAVATNPKDGAFWDTLARVAMKQGDKARATAAFEKAVDLQPKDIPARVGLVQSYLAEGDKSRAKSVLTQIDSLLLAGSPSLQPDTRHDLQSLREQVNH